MNDLRLPTPTEMEILNMLHGGKEMYGLEMVKASKALKRGTIYVLLGRLTEKGFVKSRQENDETVPGMPRRLYRITGNGELARNARAQANAILNTASEVAV